MAAGKVDPIDIREGASNKIAAELKKKLGRVKSKTAKTYSLALQDGLLFTPALGFQDFKITYAVKVDVKDETDAIIASSSCSGVDSTQMSEEAWRASPKIIDETVHRVVSICSQKLSSELFQ